MWRSTVYSAANRLGSAQDFLDASGEILRERLGLHGPRNLIDLVERDVARMLDVFLLFTIPWGF